MNIIWWHFRAKTDLADFTFSRTALSTVKKIVQIYMELANWVYSKWWTFMIYLFPINRIWLLSPLNGAKFLTLVNDNYKTKNKERKVVPASKIYVLVNTKFQNFEVELTQFWKKNGLNVKFSFVWELLHCWKIFVGTECVVIDQG